LNVTQRHMVSLQQLSFLLSFVDAVNGVSAIIIFAFGHIILVVIGKQM